MMPWTYAHLSPGWNVCDICEHKACLELRRFAGHRDGLRVTEWIVVCLECATAILGYTPTIRSPSRLEE